MRALSTATFLLSALTSVSAVPAPQQTETLPSGLIIEHTSGPVICDRPTRKHDKVAMHYKGSLLSNGKEFDQSYKRGKPFQFVLGAGKVIKGWDEGLLDMCIGQSRKLTIPPELGYGSRGAGRDIPPNAVLVFETKLMDIVELSNDPEPEKTTTISSVANGVISTFTGTAVKTTIHGTAKPTITVSGSRVIVTPLPTVTRIPDHKDGDDGDNDDKPPGGRCELLGPFALVAQGALGALALLTLVWKRWREVPKRPWKIFFFDVSKQVFGSMLLHVINLAMSMLGAGDVADAAAAAVSVEDNGSGKTPNPCSFYLLNLGIDTTLGVPVLYVLLKVLHRLFAYTPLANPPQSIKSGNYGQPPKATWYFKQLLIYCIGLIGMKLFVFFLFMAMPFLPWIGDWALRWTEGNEALQVAFALFIFPLIMNAVQYWIIDSFIMDKKQAESGGDYQRVEGDEEDSESGRLVPEEEAVHVSGKHADDQATLREVEPEPVTSPYADSEGSGKRK